MLFVVGMVKASIVFISGALFFLICAIDESGKRKKGSETEDKMSKEVMAVE
jgi:hypothetical protein